LQGQFRYGLDKVRLYFDGEPTIPVEYFKEELSMFNIDIFWAVSPKLGYWGHGIRNTYQTDCTTDYIHHMDDDDIYSEGVIPGIRQELKANYGKVLICKFRTLGDTVIWKNPSIQFGQVGTPSGFIFNRPEIFGFWGYEYGGDFNFYKEVEEKIGKENLVFNPTVVVKTRPQVYGY
jgi:hypothetical protein